MGYPSSTSSQRYARLILSDVQAIAAEEYHTIFLKTNGEAWGAGDNAYGQLGMSGSDRSSPTFILSGVKAIAANYMQTFFLTNNGQAWSTGYNGYGQLGDGSTSTRYSPVNVMSNVAA